MAHLTPEQMLDLAEGTRSPADFPHIDACAACAAQVEASRGRWPWPTEVDVPEPSPFFWDHLSGRIRDRVAQDVTRWPAFAPAWRIALTAAAAAVLVLAVGMALRRGVTPPPDPAPVGVEAIVTIDEDAALALLADLSADLDWDAASEAGLVPAQGAVDNVLVALTGEERTELQRILQEALSGA